MPGQRGSSYRGTPIRTFRLNDEDWSRVVDAAGEDGTTAAELVRTAVEAYLSKRSN